MNNTYTSTVLFAGAGLMDLAIAASGGKVIQAVEQDEKIAQNYHHNFPDTKLWVADINNVDPSEFEPTQDVHGSPPCTNASIANPKGCEQASDISLSLSFLNIVKSMHNRSCGELPLWITVENVWSYSRFQAFILLRNGLLKLGYCYSLEKLDAADVGVPQNRVRMWARFALPKVAPVGTIKSLKGGILPPITKKLPPVGWYQAIAHLIPELPESNFANWQRKRLLVKFGVWNKIKERSPTVQEVLNLQIQMGKLHSAMLIERVGSNNKGPQVLTPEKPAFTVRALGKDNHWRQMDCWTPNSVKSITPEALWHLQMYRCDRTYHWLEGTSNVVKCKGIGNGIPFLMGLEIKNSLLNTVT